MLSLVDAHAADWEESQDRGALVREDDSEDGEGGLFAPLPFPSGKDPVNKAASRKRPTAGGAATGGEKRKRGKRAPYMCWVCGKPKKGHVCTGPPETAVPAAAPATAALAAANQPFQRDASDASSSTEAPPTTDEGRDDPANDWVLCD